MSSRSMPFMGGVMLLTFLANEDTPAGFKLEHGECCPHSNRPTKPIRTPGLAFDGVRDGAKGRSKMGIARTSCING